MDKTNYILEFLYTWQNEVHEEVDTVSDIKAFNTIGLIIGMINGHLLSLSKVHELITEVLNLSTEEKERIYTVFANAYEYASSKVNEVN